jgi:molybdopterin molybdotransferase
MDSKEPISVEQARAIIAASVNPLPEVILAIEKTNGLTLAEDIYSPLDIPAYDQSSMDGYAIYIEDITETLTLQGVMQAGTPRQVQLERRQAMRIFTGAPLPSGADTVIMQEKVSAEPEQIKIEDWKIEKGTHVRMRGAELKKGELVLQKGTQISAPIIGLLASIGIIEIRICPPPFVTIITTGKELQKPGSTLNFGQVYESNAYFLSAALKQLSVQQLQLMYADDNLELIEQKISLALENSDIILLTGGISVGDFDFVRKATDRNGILCKFHKVKQKPGKPFYFGMKENKLVFGLPGNPASVITCFYEYVLSAIGYIIRRHPQVLTTAFLKDGYKKAAGLTQFLKGYAEGGIVEILEAQESFRLRSFSKANCLVCLDEHRVQYDKGEIVTINLLPL